MRPWLVLHHSGLPFKTHEIRLFVEPGWQDEVQSFSGAGKVPVLVDKNLSVHESLAICEYVAELAPSAGLWPEDRALRARGRAISSEMATSFGNLRSEMPANIRGRVAASRTPSPAAQRDIDRVFDIWRASLATSPGPFLLGDFSIADAMYYPVLTRFRTYGVPLPAEVAAWAERLEAHPAVEALVAEAHTSAPIPKYDAQL
jgi:glutathione S-transferase